MNDDIDLLNRARETARSFAEVAGEMSAFLDRTSGVPTAEQTAEYATLLARAGELPRSARSAGPPRPAHREHRALTGR